MLNAAELADIKKLNPENPDVEKLLREIEVQKERQRTAIGWIARDVLPAMKSVWHHLLAKRPIPEECLTIDTAIAQIEGDLRWLYPKE
jgi:hypothetical protein